MTERSAIPNIDGVLTADEVRATAEHIAGARFVGYPEGGHLFVGHEAEVMRRIADFLHAP